MTARESAPELPPLPEPARDTEGPRGTYGCACVSDSAHACAEIRYGYREIPEPCECMCHQWRDDDDE
jgi:hypothetical protein